MDHFEKQTYKSQTTSIGAFETVGIWHQIRADFLLDCVMKFKNPNRNYSVLDIGSGNAYFATVASKYTKWNFTCVDPAYLASPGQIKTIKFSNSIPTEKFDLIFVLDVLEHIEDEDSLLSLLDDLMKQDSLLVITVPLWPNLKGIHDKILGHHRRYNETEVKNIFSKKNLNCCFQSQFFLFPLIFRCLEKIFNFYKSQELNSFTKFKIILNIDIFILSLFLKLNIKYYGLSWVGIYKKGDIKNGSYTFH